MLYEVITRIVEGDPHRLYRKIRYGADVEVFLLDTRQYRSRNADQDGPAKTMLGARQLRWLLDELQASDATWKVIVTSVPVITSYSIHYTKLYDPTVDFLSEPAS